MSPDLEPWTAAGPWGLVRVERGRPDVVDLQIAVGTARPVGVEVSGERYLVAPCPDGVMGLVQRAILAAHVESSGGFVLHASAVVSEGVDATLFLGRSGSGKTTVSTQAKGALLGDDTVVIWRGERGLEVVSTPFVSDGGRLAETRSGTPRAVCTLRWGTSPRLDRLDDRVALRALVESIYRPLGPTLNLAVAKSLLDLVGMTRAYRLTFPREYRFDPSIFETEAG